MEIIEVTPGSLAEEAGLEAGQRVVGVNGQRVRDFLDLHLWLGEEDLELEIEDRNVYGQPRSVYIHRTYGRDLGLTFPDERIRICGNDCPFCFVDQLPAGLRKNLYVRDDDYRFSYLYGHFITLTNLKEHEFERIIEQQLSPLYVSVHALDPKVRERVLVSKRAGEIRRRIEQLLEGGITLHTQVVVVPGLNDDDVLRETIFGLADYYPGVESISVVPVGLTGHRQDLPEVRTLDRAEARRITAQVRRYGRTMQRRLGDTFCYVADEMVLLAGRPVPSAGYYGDFGQRENGVGLVRSTLDFLASAPVRERELQEHGIRRVWILTGESFGPVLDEALDGLQARFNDTALHAVTVENKLFGRPTTVAGLLSGRDLLEAARGRVAPGDLVLVPDEAVNEHGVFLDDVTPAHLAEELGVPVHAGWEPLLGDADRDTLDEVFSLEAAS